MKYLCVCVTPLSLIFSVQRRWASSGQPVAKVTNRAKTAIPKDQKISLSLLQKTNGMTRPHTAVINNTMQEVCVCVCVCVCV